MTSSTAGGPLAGGPVGGGPYGRMVAGRASYLVLHNTAEIVTPDATGTRIVRYPRGGIAFRDGKVLELGPGAELLRRHGEARPVNANGRLVTPGLVDCHTHMIFAGHRARELQRKLSGESYAAIAKSGGGIRTTVTATAAERDDVLERSLAGRLERWRANACTTVEVKSGYGLTPAGELRLLELMRGAGNRVPVRMVRTALLLHALPEAYQDRREAYVREMIDRVLPEIVRREFASAVDVFCDPVGFTVAECRAVLEAARGHGLAVRLHAEQTKRAGGAQLAAELQAAEQRWPRATDDAGANDDDLHETILVGRW